MSLIDTDDESSIGVRSATSSIMDYDYGNDAFSDDNDDDGGGEIVQDGVEAIVESTCKVTETRVRPTRPASARPGGRVRPQSAARSRPGAVSSAIFSDDDDEGR